VRDAPEYHLGSIDRSKLLFKGDEKTALLGGQGNVRVDVLAPRYLRLQVDAKTDIQFIVRQFYYPDWRCTTPGANTDCQVTRFNSALPLIMVSTTPGNKQIELRLSSPGERMGYLASVIGLLLLISLCCLNRFLGRRTQRGGGAS
jgi:hypothetical protein